MCIFIYIGTHIYVYNIGINIHIYMNIAHPRYTHYRVLLKVISQKKGLHWLVKENTCVLDSYFHMYTETHCNTLQHTATHCKTMQHTTTRCNTL